MRPPRASEYEPEGTPAPARMLDFPRLKDGYAFIPDEHHPFITAWWLPRLPWRATAKIVTVTESCLHWTETNTLGIAPLTVPFFADVILWRVNEWQASLTVTARVGSVSLRPLTKTYEIVGAQRNLLLLRDLKHPADMISVARQVGDVVQFHMRMRFRVAIHKSGQVVSAATT